MIAETTNVAVTYDPDLMEQNNGVIAGMLREEALIKYPLPLGGRKRHAAIEGGNLKCSSGQGPSNSCPSCLLP